MSLRDAREDVERELDVADYQRTIDRLLRQNSKLKASTEALVAAVYQAARDASAALTIPPVTAPTRDRRRAGAEVAVPWLTDWQLAKITPSYSSEVCEERISLYGDKVVTLTEIQRADHPVRKAHVWITGDIVEGELIFPGQHWLIDASLYQQVCVDGPRILCDFLRRMLGMFESVHVTAVIGNHGRLGGRSSRDYNPESNADRMLYRICQGLLADEKRLTWAIPDGGRERNWYAIDRIGNYSCLLFHGDQIRGGFAGFPFYGLAKKVWGWKAGGIRETFDDCAFGHWHQNVDITLNSTIARCAGSPESDNTYAQEQLASMGRPSQRLLFVHPEKGMVTAEYKVWLD